MKKQKSNFLNSCNFIQTAEALKYVSYGVGVYFHCLASHMCYCDVRCELSIVVQDRTILKIIKLSKMCFEVRKSLRSVEMQTFSVTHNMVAILHDPQPGLCSHIQFLDRSEFGEMHTNLCGYIQNSLLKFKRGFLDIKICKNFTNRILLSFA
jgi:hypothetical protein